MSLLEPSRDWLDLPLERSGERVGTLRLERLPDDNAARLIDARGRPDAEPSIEPVRIQEGGEYRYQIHLDIPGDSVRVDRELLSPDDKTGLRGRLRAGLRTGRLRLSVELDGQRLTSAPLEVLSKKLDYLTHYRSMLDAIASLGAGLVLERFAASEQRLRPDQGAESTSAYQRFCFLRGLLDEGGITEALQRIVSQPAVAFEEIVEERPITRGLPATAAAARELCRPGPRLPYPGTGPLASLPRVVRHARTEPTTDTIPNRFVRFVLDHWLALLDDIDRALEAEARTTGPTSRGRHEVAEVRAALEEALRHDVLRTAAPLRTFPAANPTLMRRGGYREVYRAFLLTEAGASLAWDAGEEIFGAGQKNVAALYEYWVFLELARLVGEVSGDTRFDLSDLVVPSSNGWALDLTRGKELTCHGRVRRLGRDLEVRLSFNRTFRPGIEGGSWTRQLRPDCTLEIRIAGADVHPLQVHFDAKYKLDDVKQLAAADEVDDLDELFDRTTRAKPADLLKMHAYRDAIVHAAGAWVVFPGAPTAQAYGFKRWGEVLPGIGALPMRPDGEGRSEGADRIRTFLEELLLHAATQTTRHERARFWEKQLPTVTTAPRREAAPLSRPPADTETLFGFVRTTAQLQWIREKGWYNLRADPHRRGSVLRGDARPLEARMVVLYGEGLDPEVEVREIVGSPLVRSREQMAEDGYPHPTSLLYLLLPVGPRLEGPRWLTRGVVDRLRKRRNVEGRSPFTATWHELTDVLDLVSPASSK